MKDRLGQRGREVTLHAAEQLKCMELSCGTDDEPPESLWVIVRGQINVDDDVVGVSTSHLTRKRSS